MQKPERYSLTEAAARIFDCLIAAIAAALSEFSKTEYASYFVNARHLPANRKLFSPPGAYVEVAPH